jgi:hypothetical protein
MRAPQTVVELMSDGLRCLRILMGATFETTFCITVIESM